MEPLKIKPVYDKTIWAGERLSRIRHEKSEGYGTSWEISAHPYCSNVVVNTLDAGKTLQELIDSRPVEMLGRANQAHLMRCAFLDAAAPLSIQVHPNESYARNDNGDHGKTESWYILEAEAGATLVAGVNNDNPAVIKKAIAEKTLEQYLIKHPVKAGDFIHIPCGELHALGAGILAIEMGTNSNTTYRFYDYGRKGKDGKERELHLDKSFDVVDLDLHSQVKHFRLDNLNANCIQTMVECDDYKMEVIDVVDSMVLDSEDCFNCLVVVEGQCLLESSGKEIEAKRCDSFFIPASCAKYQIKGKCRIIRGIPHISHTF